MKVVLASTVVQEEKLHELISYMYTSVFPTFFTDQEIREYIDLNILHIPQAKDELLFTLDGAFQAITSLEVIISILESMPKQNCRKYEFLFNHNVKKLEQAGLSFPFLFDNFFSYGKKKASSCSIYSEPANEYLI